MSNHSLCRSLQRNVQSFAILAAAFAAGSLGVVKSASAQCSNNTAGACSTGADLCGPTGCVTDPDCLQGGIQREVCCDGSIRGAGVVQGPAVTCPGEQLRIRLGVQYGDFSFLDATKVTGLNSFTIGGVNGGPMVIDEILGNAICTGAGCANCPAGACPAGCTFPCILGPPGCGCSDSGLTLGGANSPIGRIVMKATHIATPADNGDLAVAQFSMVSLNNSNCNTDAQNLAFTQTAQVVVGVADCPDNDPCRSRCCAAGVCTDLVSDCATHSCPAGAVSVPPIPCSTTNPCASGTCNVTTPGVTGSCTGVATTAINCDNGDTCPDSCNPDLPNNTPACCVRPEPPDLTLCKQDTAGNPLAGIELCVTGPQNTCCTTGASGCCDLDNLDDGAYNVSEPNPPAGSFFDGCTPANPINLACDGARTTVTCTNRPDTPPAGCRITAGRTNQDVNPDPPPFTDIIRGQGGGQVGAPCGCIGCFDEFNHIQGNWQYSRKNKKGTFHAKEYNSLICGCEPTSPLCDGSGIPGAGFNNPANFAQGELCNPDDTVIGPEPRPAPANIACFSGMGDFAETSGRKTIKAAFRVEVEDRGEPSVGGNADDTCDVHRIRIWVPASGEDAESLADSVCCTIGNDANRNVPGVRLPNIDDGGNLTHGNIQIHPQTPNSRDGTCPVPNGSCQQ